MGRGTCPCGHSGVGFWEVVSKGKAVTYFDLNFKCVFVKNDYEELMKNEPNSRE